MAFQKKGCVLGFGLALVACGSPGGGASGDPSGSGTEGTGGSDEGSSGEGSTGGPPSGQCGEAIEVGPTPLRRLTRAEYNNTVRDLLGDTSRIADGFVPDETVMGFAANAEASVADLDVENYVGAAETLAAGAMADVDTWLGCDLADSECVEPWIEDFAGKAYRRPLSEPERDTLLEIYADGRDTWGASFGLELAIATALASPQFLYHVELGDPAQGELAVPLLPHEMAARLSYFVWSTMPDDALFAAAEADELRTAQQVEDQVRRMVGDPRFGDSILSFSDQWLELGVLGDLGKDPEMFPQWSPELAVAARSETLTFFDAVIRTGDATLGTLLTAPFSYVDEDLAELYGVPAPATPFERADLDPTERAGFLTQVGFLAAKSHETENSWVYRGRFVRARLLCEELPAPPPGINFNEGNNPDRLEDEACASCHRLMDPIGMGFDDFDPIGRFEDKGSIGEILGGGELSGEFTGAVELAEALSNSEQVRDCMADTWFVYANRREAAEGDDCSSTIATDTFVESGGDLVELIVAIATSDAFRHRSGEGSQ